LILIDTTYIYSGGGKVLLKCLLTALDVNSIDYTILTDERLFNSGFFEKNKNVYVIKKNELSRFLFYAKNSNKFETILCFSSIPPVIINNRKRIIIYFHNLYFLENHTLKRNIKTILKRNFIKYFNKPSYIWYVQSDLVKDKLTKGLNIRNEKIEIMPFFDILENTNTLVNNDTIKYSYIADSSPHKNHISLLENWEVFFNKYSKQFNLELNLTIDDANGNLKKLINQPGYLEKHNIINHGQLNRIKALDLLKKSNYLVFVSKFESFGLPLIEACQLGCKVIAPDIDYVNCIIEPSLKYNPNDNLDLSIILEKSLNIQNARLPILKIENKINSIINNLVNV
jgi:hypothetical protein